MVPGPSGKPEEWIGAGQGLISGAVRPPWSGMLFFAGMQKTGIQRKTFQVAAEMTKLAAFRGELYELCAEEGVPAQSTRLMVLAVDEAISNIVEHAKLPENCREISVKVEIAETQISVWIRDRGRPFDPRPPRHEPDKSSYPRRGFGLYLIHKIVNDIDYERTNDGQNVLKLTKVIG